MGLYLVQSVKGANLFTKLACAFLLIAMFTGWIAYCTANWGRRYTETSDLNLYSGYGVWRIANNAYKNSGLNAGLISAPAPSIEHTDGWLLDWYAAFQAFATGGFICLNAGFILLILFTFVGPCKLNSNLGFWNAINNIFGSICWLIAVILFGAYFDNKFDLVARNIVVKERKLSYSFVFAVITFALQLATGIVLLLTKRGGGAVTAK